MQNATMVLIRKETAKQLKKKAIAKFDTYDEIIQRLLKNAKD
jgi:hypothetical protein